MREGGKSLSLKRALGTRGSGRQDAGAPGGGIERLSCERALAARLAAVLLSVHSAARGVALRDLDFAALDELWDGAKAEEALARTGIGEQA